MSVVYRSTCRPTIGQPLSVDISTDLSVECQSTYRPMLDRYVGRYIERHISVNISTDTRPICRRTYWSTLGWYVNQYVSRVSVDMSTDMSVEGCTKYTWSDFLRGFYSKRLFLKGCNTKSKISEGKWGEFHQLTGLLYTFNLGYSPEKSSYSYGTILYILN